MSRHISVRFNKLTDNEDSDEFVHRKSVQSAVPDNVLSLLNDDGELSVRDHGGRELSGAWQQFQTDSGPAGLEKLVSCVNNIKQDIRRQRVMSAASYLNKLSKFN